MSQAQNEDQNEAKYFYLCSLSRIAPSLRQTDLWGHAVCWAGKIGPVHGTQNKTLP